MTYPSPPALRMRRPRGTVTWYFEGLMSPSSYAARALSCDRAAAGSRVHRTARASTAALMATACAGRRWDASRRLKHIRLLPAGRKPPVALMSDGFEPCMGTACLLIIGARPPSCERSTIGFSPRPSVSHFGGRSLSLWDSRDWENGDCRLTPSFGRVSVRLWYATFWCKLPCSGALSGKEGSSGSRLNPTWWGGSSYWTKRSGSLV